MRQADPDLTGRTVSHYRIERKLGQGGMGVVYLARDTRLDRAVAVKVLPGRSTLDGTRRKRFMREARAASALNHPNIITVHDVGRDDGVDFIAMEYVDGVPLGDLIRRGLPIDKAVGLARQIAGALAAAHEAGIVHRDLKPANIMVTGKGQVKRLDFGLAKLAAGESADGLASTMTASLATEPGVVLGTLAYMSPEQAAGDPVGPRSDIFSFGCVLYEMITGRRAFSGQTGVEIIGRLLNEDPPSPSEVTQGLPQDLERIIERCLRKDVERRSQHMSDVKIALDELPAATLSTAPAPAVSAPRRGIGRIALVGALLIAAAVIFATSITHWRAGPAPIGRIAVLPLENISGDASQDYFAAGMTEALIDKLGRVGGLRVTSRVSVMRYKGADRPPVRDIGAALGVDALVDGSAVRVGDQVRVTAQLVDARIDEVLWTDTYDRPLADVPVLQSDIAQAITNEISVAVTAEETRLLKSAPPVDSKAYDLYLRGNYEFNFGPAQAEDPGFGPAYSGLGTVLAFRAYWGLAPPVVNMPRARELMRQAITLDATSSDAHGAMAALLTYDAWDWSGAEREFETAIKLDPSNAENHFQYGLLLTLLRRWDDAMVEFSEAVRLDPYNPTFVGGSAMPSLSQGQYDAAPPAFGQP